MQRRKLLQTIAIGGVGTALGLGANPFRKAIASEGGSGWGYIGEGAPENWGEMSSAYQVCRAGVQQSPINLEEATEAELAAIEVSYQPIPLTVLNNGHTIQVNAEAGNSIQLDGEEFELLQFHFHHPSEHHVSGEPYPMEVHFVHQNAKGELAVLGVFLKEGAENVALKPVWKSMPSQKAKAKTVAGAMVDIAGLLPESNKVFRYFGSLTTPPCTEIVRWVVFEQPIELSTAQIEQFSNIFPLNARPIQPLGRRHLLNSI